MIRVLAAVLVVFCTATVGLAKIASQENDQTLSPNEEREVREFAKRIQANFEKTRDLTRYLNKPPTSEFLDKVINDPDDPIGVVDKHVAQKVGRSELRRFFIAMLNIACLGQTYVYSRFLLQQTSVRDLLLEQQYPAQVVRFMKRNPAITKWWRDIDSSDTDKCLTSVGQFYSVLHILTRAADLMRAYFRKHSPERTAVYKQNLKYLDPFLNEIRVDTCQGEQHCAPLPLRTQTIRVNLPVLQLLLVRLKGRLQVLIIGLHED